MSALDPWAFKASRPVEQQWRDVWYGSTPPPSPHDAHSSAEVFQARADCAVLAGDESGWRITGFSDGYQPGDAGRLRVQASTASSGQPEVDGSEAWYAWAIRWPQHFSCWEGLGFSNSSYHVTHPGYGMHGWRSPSAGTYALQIKAGHTPSPKDSGTKDAYGQNGIGDYNPLTRSNAPAGVTNPNGVDVQPVILGPGGKRPLELNVWQYLIEHVVWKAQEPGLLRIYHATPADTDFTELYTGTHPTLAWNERNGVTACHLGFQVYRGAPAPSVVHDLAGIRRLQSYEAAKALFFQAPPPEPEPAPAARRYRVSFAGTVSVEPLE